MGGYDHWERMAMVLLLFGSFLTILQEWTTIRENSLHSKLCETSDLLQ